MVRQIFPVLVYLNVINQMQLNLYFYKSINAYYIWVRW